jgi:hypothetical protein
MACPGFPFLRKFPLHRAASPDFLSCHADAFAFRQGCCTLVASLCDISDITVWQVIYFQRENFGNHRAVEKSVFSVAWGRFREESRKQKIAVDQP